MSNLQDPALRRAVYDRDGGLCGFCGRQVTADWMDIDHIQPQALGGSDELSNLRASHPNCNRRAGQDVRAIIAARRAVPMTVVQIDLPPSTRALLRSRAEREKRSTNAEIQAMIEWALRHMPEQLESS